MAINRMRYALIVFFLSGCTLGPDFTAPEVASPPSWFRDAKSGQPSEAIENEAVNPQWWQILHDPMLDDLVERVAVQNLDIRTATSRIEQSRAQRGVTAADFYPQVEGDASYQREKLSDVGIISIAGGGAGASGGAGGGTGGIPSTSTTAPFNLYQYGFDVSWEIDLWGRVRRGVEAADANTQASIEDLHGTVLSGIAELVRDYVQLRGVQANIETTRENADAATRIADLVRDRARAGLSSDMDTASARAQAASIQAQLPQLGQQKAMLMNAIALLLAQPPGALEKELDPPRPIPPSPPKVPIGVPSELARRRPDIREAEAKLHAATAEIGVVEADFFPRLTLMGNGMMQSLDFSDLNAWAAHSYTFGPSVTLPIFEGGRLVSTLDLRNAAQREAALQYEKTVLTAFHEVDNALTAFRSEQDRRAALLTAVEQNHMALDLAVDLYRQGLSNFVNVLTAEQNLVAAEQEAIVSTQTVSVNMVQLYKTLGGGWEQTASAAAAPELK